jgi:hypothetical protein
MAPFQVPIRTAPRLHHQSALTWWLCATQL